MASLSNRPLKSTLSFSVSLLLYSIIVILVILIILIVYFLVSVMPLMVSHKQSDVGVCQPENWNNLSLVSPELNGFNFYLTYLLAQVGPTSMIYNT